MTLFFILFLTGLIAGAIDAIAGGGGLITLPMLLSVGVPPHMALGTNKLQSSVGTSIAAWSYHRRGLLSLQNVSEGLIAGALGALLGAVLGQVISGSVLKQAIPILLFLILIYSLFSPRLGSIDAKPRMQEPIFFAVFGFLLSFYDGFLGPGTGSFWVFAIVFFLGYNITKATAYTKLFNLNSNLIALACFAIGGNVDYRIGFCMALGQILGGKLGAHLAITRGERIIRPLFILMVCTTILILIYRNYFHQVNGGYIVSVASLLIAAVLGFYFCSKKFKP